MAAGLILLILFILSQQRGSNPLIKIELFTKNRLFAYSNLASLINYSATYAIVFLLSLYLQKVGALSPKSAGMILIAQPIVMALFSPITGRLSDYIQPRYLSSAGMALCALGLFFLGFLGEGSSVLTIVIILVFVGLGFALFSSPNMNTIMSSVDKTNYGVASGTASTMRVLGQMVSMTIVTLLFATLFNGYSIEDVDNALFIKMIRIGFHLFAAICVIGIYFSFNRGAIVRE